MTLEVYIWYNLYVFLEGVAASKRRYACWSLKRRIYRKTGHFPPLVRKTGQKHSADFDLPDDVLLKQVAF